MPIKVAVIFVLLSQSMSICHTIEVQLFDCIEPSGPNVCERLEEYTVDEISTERIPYQERKIVWCANIPPRCSKYEIKFKVVNITKLVKKIRKVKDCCEGYGKNLAGDQCVPICTEDCIHGECLGPEQCECEVGYFGTSCDISKSLP